MEPVPAVAATDPPPANPGTPAGPTGAGVTDTKVFTPPVKAKKTPVVDPRFENFISYII